MRTSAFSTERERMGYLAAAQRPSCHNCGHCKRVEPTGAPGDRHTLRCQSAGMGTTAMAVCARHVYAKTPPPPPAPATPEAATKESP